MKLIISIDKIQQPRLHLRSTVRMTYLNTYLLDCKYLKAREQVFSESKTRMTSYLLSSSFVARRTSSYDFMVSPEPLAVDWPRLRAVCIGEPNVPKPSLADFRSVDGVAIMESSGELSGVKFISLSHDIISTRILLL